MSRRSLADDHNPFPSHRGQIPPLHNPYCQPLPFSQQHSLSQLYQQLMPHHPHSISLHPWSTTPNPPPSWYSIQPGLYLPAITNRGFDSGGSSEPIKALSRGAHVPRVKEHLTGPENYSNWCMMVRWLFITNQVLPYIEGTILCPDSEINPDGAHKWIQNDAFECFIIGMSLHSYQRKHIKCCDTSYTMWKALKAVNESCRHLTVINYIHTLFHCAAEEDTDIPCHLDIIKETWECINVLRSAHFQISDLFFKIIIAF